MIDTAADLADALAVLKTATEVAVDLEADSMFHYQEKVCLIQMATDRINVVIDPLPIGDLSSLKPLFAKRNVKKVFHGADYDVRSLFRDFGIVIHNLFDTQVAAMFLGMRETGLDAVLQQRFGIHLDKKYQKKDWSCRPLPREMIEYAAGDVFHLLALARMMEKELAEKDRLWWVEEECRLLSLVRASEPDDSPLFLRIKGAGKLDRRGLAVLENLLELRHRIARKKDRPLFKVFGSKALMKIAADRPKTLRALEKCDGLSPRQVDMHGEALIRCVTDGLAVPPPDLPTYPRTRSPSVPSCVPDRVLELRRWRDAEAEKLGIDPTLLFNKATMGAIALEKPQTLKQLGGVEGIKSWQKKAYGRQVVTLLKGMR
ncbi:MAG: ribonuclease D [Desulfobacterales bacterium]|nr:ribonuclease D [Desulfobacterales bacterium]